MLSWENTVVFQRLAPDFRIILASIVLILTEEYFQLNNSSVNKFDKSRWCFYYWLSAVFIYTENYFENLGAVDWDIFTETIVCIC